MNRPLNPADLQVGREYDFALSTHCGVREMVFAKLVWELADPVPSNDDWSLGINWDEPAQRGVIQLKTPEIAVFTAQGVSLTYKLRVGAICVAYPCA